MNQVKTNYFFDTSNVINLSKHSLTKAQTEVLSLGLGFCPEQSHVLFNTIKDLNMFVRKLTLTILHHKTTAPPAGISTLMQLSLSECRELRELLLAESQEPPSSPSPPLEALEALQNTNVSVPIMDYTMSPSLAHVTSTYRHTNILFG